MVGAYSAHRECESIENFETLLIKLSKRTFEMPLFRTLITWSCLLVFASGSISAEGAKPEEPIIGNATTSITVLDMEALMSGVNGAQQYKLFTDREQVKRVAHKLFVNRLLAQEARETGVAEEPLHAAVLAQKTEEYLASVRLKALDEEPIPDMAEAAREQYLANPESYSTPTLVRVAHVLIRFKNRTGQTRPKEEARKLIESIRQRLLNGEDFESVAVETSEDPSVNTNKGDLGFFGRGRMVEAFEKAAFALREPGALSDVIETSFGFHVIKLVDRKDGELKPFDDVRDEIVSGLEVNFRRQRRSEYVDELKERSGRVLYEDVFNDYVNEKRALMGIDQQSLIDTGGTEPADGRK